MSRLNKSIKPSQGFGCKDKVDLTMFPSTFASMKQQCWMGAWMKMKELVHQSEFKVGGCVGIYKTRVDMRISRHVMDSIF